MTRARETAAHAGSRKGLWALQDAKARFSEVVRKAKTEGPQRITVHGREEVIVVSVEEYRRVKGERTVRCSCRRFRIRRSAISRSIMSPRMRRFAVSSFERLAA
jgi:prevent-host-death family protein